MYEEDVSNGDEGCCGNVGKERQSYNSEEKVERGKDKATGKKMRFDGVWYQVTSD